MIPIWDMCNHEEGVPSTLAVVSEKSKTKEPISKDMQIICKAKRDFKQHSQFYFSYSAKRSTLDFLMVAGFVPAKQQLDDFLEVILPPLPKSPEPWLKILETSNIDLKKYFVFPVYDKSIPKSFI